MTGHNRLTLRFYEHRSDHDALKNAQTENDIKNLADNIAPLLLSKIQNDPPNDVFTVNSSGFNHTADLHTDVWISDMAGHARLYTNQTSPPSLPSPAAGLSVNQKTLVKQKHFSGDVSGGIGETGFAWILSQKYQIQSNHFVHLRPVKQKTGMYPDFEIHIPSFGLKTDIANLALKTTDPLYPFPCEVKATTNPTHGTIKSQLKKAIRQLNSYWKFYQRSVNAGLISVALRNSNQKSYDIVFLWMR